MSIEALANSLSGAEKAAVLSAELVAGKVLYIRWPDAMKPEDLQSKGLSFFVNIWFDCLTPTGATVHAYLKKAG